MRIVTDFPRPIQKLDPVWIPMPDGVKLAATIWMPKDAESDPVPAILELIPYRRRDFYALGDQPQHSYFAGHGYASVRVDIRGSGDSEGLMHDEYTAQELQDGSDIIAWLARQSWCSGSVGMRGISWGGFNSLQVAALRPPALKAIVTCCSTDDRYADDVHYMGGVMSMSNPGWGGAMFLNNSRSPDPAVVGSRWRQMWLERLDKMCQPWAIKWMRHQRRDSQWTHGSVCENYADITCAVFAVGGWSDGYTNAIPRLMEHLTCPKKALIGPWGHTWPEEGRPGPAIGYLQEEVRWYDHWLKGKDTGMMREPAIRAWISEPLPPAHNYSEIPGRWIAEPAWPPRVESQAWALNPGRLEREAGPESVVSLAPSLRPGTYPGGWCPYGNDGDFPLDQRYEDGFSLCFETAPFAHRTELLGAPVLEAEIEVDRPVAHLIARLNLVAPDGKATRLTYGVLNLAHRESHADPQAPEAGRRYRVRIQLNDIGQAIAPGCRLRLALSTSYWGFFWPAPQPVRLGLVTGASRLLLPVRAPQPGDEALPLFGAIEMGPPLEHTVLSPSQRKREMRHDVLSGRVVLRNRQIRGRTRIHETGMEFGSVSETEYSVLGDDPLSARWEQRFTCEMARGDWRVRTEGVSLLTSTETDYLLSYTLDAYEGERRVFTRSWDARIPRDHN